MFAKRHYEAIAQVLQDLGIEPSERRHVAACFAGMFARDNGQFKRERFLAACEPGANVKLRTRYKVAS